MADYFLKKYLIENIVSKLDDCKPFTEVYGKNYATQKANNNIRSIEVNDAGGKLVAGAYDITNEVLVLNGKKDDELNIIKKLNEDEKFNATALHESIHAVFKRSLEECIGYDIECGTGLNEIYNMPNGETLFMGVAINEGYTNWLVKKTGTRLPSDDGYVEYENIIDILETIIGEKNVMKFGIGNQEHNMEHVLGMSAEEYIEFIGMTDEHFAGFKNNNRLDLFYTLLKNYNDEYDKDPESANEKAKMAEAILKDTEYISDLMEADYYDHIEKYGKADTMEEKLQYMKNAMAHNDQRQHELMARIYETLYDKYIKNEINTLLDMKKIPKEDMERMTKLYNSLRRYRGDEEIEFDGKYAIIAGRYKRQALNELKKAKSQGNLTASKLDSLINVGYVGRNNAYKDLIFSASKIIDSNHELEVSSLINFLLNYEGSLEDAGEYSVIDIYTKNKDERTEVYKKQDTICGAKINGKLKFCNDDKFRMDIQKSLDENGISNILNLNLSRERNELVEVNKNRNY